MEEQEYKIVDISSRYFGSCFMVCKLGVPFAVENSYKDAYDRIPKPKLFINIDGDFVPLGIIENVTFGRIE